LSDVFRSDDDITPGQSLLRVTFELQY
jgi:hypothetical protein